MGREGHVAEKRRHSDCLKGRKTLRRREPSTMQCAALVPFLLSLPSVGSINLSHLLLVFFSSFFLLSPTRRRRLFDRSKKGNENVSSFSFYWDGVALCSAGSIGRVSTLLIERVQV